MPTALRERQLDPSFAYDLRRVTERAALAAQEWIGRGAKEEGDAAAVDAMRAELARLDIAGTIVIGEGDKDHAPQLYGGEEVGSGRGPHVDIAVDPVEGTSYLAKGMTNAMATVAVASRGTMFDPGPCYYMDKLAVGPEAAGVVDPAAPVASNLAAIAKALGKGMSELTVYVLEKPRHESLVREIRSQGARVALYPAGDVAGAIIAAMPGGGVDVLLGIGGTPEGVLSACAIATLGGAFFGRLAPQLPSEISAVATAGLDTGRWMELTDLVSDPSVMFAATGITSGLLVDGVDTVGGRRCTETFLTNAATGEYQFVSTFHADRSTGRGPQ